MPDPAGAGPPIALLALAVLSFAVAVLAVAYARRRVRQADLSARLARQEAERAETAERELAGVREDLTGEPDRLATLLADLAPAIDAVCAAKTRRDLGDAAGRAIERVLGPGQWMVFLDPERAGKQYVLAATAASREAPWPLGACLSPQMGRVGLAIRRRTAMVRADFDREPSLVRQHVDETEPRGFRVDAVAPIVDGDHVLGAISAGALQVRHESARAALRVIATAVATTLRTVEARQRAAQLENVDTLTGLPSRNWFNAEAAEQLYRNRERGQAMSLAVFAVDDFRLYAGREGPGEAQRLLQGIAYVLRPLFREGDLVCRWTDEEFVALMPGLDRRLAADQLDRLRRDVTEREWPGAALQPCGAVTMSVGIAAGPEDGTRLEELIDAAYRAFVRARSYGGDRTVDDRGLVSEAAARFVDDPMVADEDEVADADVPPLVHGARRVIPKLDTTYLDDDDAHEPR